MEAIDYWKLNDEFSIHETIFISIGLLPGDTSNDIERLVSAKRPKGYDALKKLLLNKIKSSQLKAKIEHIVYDDFAGTTVIDLDNTTIHRDDILSLFKSIGFRPAFFFPNVVETQSYTDRNHPSYAPKLAAGIAAWEAITNDESLLNGKTPKKAIEKWLRENATDFELTKEDGSPNESAIEEISKIANWKPEGGVAKTPTRVQKNLPTPKKLKTTERELQDTRNLAPSSQMPY